MASKTKIYMVLDFVDGGELFDKIVSLYLFCCYLPNHVILMVTYSAYFVTYWISGFDYNLICYWR
jgi:hypothetical protein